MRMSGAVRRLMLAGAAAAMISFAVSAAAPVGAGAETLTLGKTSIGRSKEVFASNRKRVNAYPLGSSATVTQLSAYLEPTTISGEQTIEGVVYADANGAPGALVGASSPVTFASTQGAGWYALPFPSALQLSTGTYWIGVLTGATWGVIGYRYDSVAGSRAVNQNTFTAGPSNPFGAFTSDSQQMSLYTVYTPGSGTTSVPVNTSPPTISGTAQQGQTLTESHGSWTNEPTSYTYQWQQCDSSGGTCHAIVGATSQTYLLGAADVGHTIRVQETAHNAGGASSPASSAVTAPVTGQGATATFGKTSVGALRDGGMFANYKIVHKATLSTAGSVTKLSLYAVPGIKSPAPQSLRGVIYADSSGSPGALVATGVEVIYQGNVNGAGWFDLPFADSVALAPGTYWLGFITGSETEGIGYLYDNVSGSRAYNVNGYGSGPTNPFGTAAKDSEQASIYATYIPAGGSVPENSALPSISGTAVNGQVLTANPGSWTNTPTGYAYAWNRCDSSGINCAAISGATASTYTLGEADVGSTLRVTVIATNEAGSSQPSRSAPTAVVTGQTTASPAHVMVIVEENRNRSEVIGASSMPYLNSLARKYGNTSKWNGVAHPSLPNYLALISGSTQGVTDDGCGYSFAGTPTIGSELSLAGISWKAYLEDLPEAGSEVCTSGEYAKKHNPFAYFPETNGPNVVPASQFTTDESSGQLPDFIFYVPNLINDGHDGTNEQVDNYLKGLIPGLLASSWYAEDGTIIITWDESNGEEEIPTVVVHGSGSSQLLTAAGNHYGTLATIESLYAVPLLGHAAGATTLAPLLK
jgi:acid phosphatase